MNVIVQSKTMVVTEAIRQFVLQQTKKMVRKGRRIAQITVFLEMVKKKKNDTSAATAKFFVDLPGRNVVVQEKARDLYEAIANAAHGTVRQLRKIKERRLTRAEQFSFSELPVEDFE